MSCLNPLHQRLSGFAHGELPREQALEVLAHAEICPSCSRDLDLYADLITVSSAALVRPQGALARWRARLPRVVFAVVVGFALLGVMDQVLGPSSRPSHAALAERVLPLTPEVREDEPFADELSAALAGWVSGDFAAIEPRLDQFLDLHPDHASARLYRAFTRREVGKLDGARADLRLLVEGTQGPLHDEAAWALANLELAAGDASAALAALALLERSQGELATRAAELAERVRAVR